MYIYIKLNESGDLSFAYFWTLTGVLFAKVLITYCMEFTIWLTVRILPVALRPDYSDTLHHVALIIG